jgi:hypothetical protein
MVRKIPDWVIADLKDALRRDVSWQTNINISWNKRRPFLSDMGIDDLGDALDYLDGFRASIIDTIENIEYYNRQVT